MDVMVFPITSFEPVVHITWVTRPWAAGLFGDIAVTDAIVPTSDASCRVVVRLDCAASGLLNRLRSWLLAWGDLVMMRKDCSRSTSTPNATSGR